MHIAEIRTIIETIPDPEIPVLNLGDLGIIREVNEVEGRVHLKISPTYTGCPATGFIESEIRDTLKAYGIRDISIERSISPPWTSDWISESGRKKMRTYGIAPPNPEGQGRPESCPQCTSHKLTRLSEFGPTPCQALWKCEECLESFSYFKCI